MSDPLPDAPIAFKLIDAALHNVSRKEWLREYQEANGRKGGLSRSREETKSSWRITRKRSVEESSGLRREALFDLEFRD